jgi:hypothetical protein
MTFAVGFAPLCIFTASFINKKSVWKIRKFDIFCGSLSIVGLLCWYVTKVGNIAILFSIFADGMAAVPTMIKSWQAPETENSTLFLLSAINALLTLLTIQTWSFAHYGFPLYILTVCIILFVLIKFKLGRGSQTTT